jgi:hypothetical protein
LSTTTKRMNESATNRLVTISLKFWRISFSPVVV